MVIHILNCKLKIAYKLTHTYLNEYACFNLIYLNVRAYIYKHALNERTYINDKMAIYVYEKKNM